MRRRLRAGVWSACLLLPHLAGCTLMDGPVGLFPGGTLRDGPLIEEPIHDWSFLSEASMIELQTVEPPRSRTMGLMQFDGEIYVQAELGYISRRMPPPRGWILAILRSVKRWHEDALADGRVVIRAEGKRYPLDAVRITDPAQFARLCVYMDDLVERMMGERLPPAPCEPDSIWFFRLDPRQIDP